MNRLGYLIQKFVYSACSFFLIISLTFFLMKMIPGDPFGEEQALPKEIHEALRHHYGLDKPWYSQYQSYLASIATGNLGPSFIYKNQTVNTIIQQGFPVSATLALEAFLIAFVIGISLGTWAAIRERQWPDYIVLIVTTISISVPSFIFATLLQYLFAIYFNLLPLAFWGSFSHTILPSIALAALPTAFIARLTRATMIEVLQTDYIKNVRAKGFSQIYIIFYHALRNSLLPVLTYSGQLLANILVGSFIIEKIFNIPGLGQWFVTSVSNRDYTVIMGLTIFYSFILITTMFLVDLAYGLLDPRVQVNKR